MVSEQLKKIKKLYGEEMMHLCRTLFPTILETPDLLLNILENLVAPTRSFAIDILKYGLQEEFKNYVLSKVKNKIKIVNSVESPFELMKKAGYTLYECKNESDIQSFRKYYKPDEVICTIERGNRLKRCYVFFAVKDNVDEIKRENFLNPIRDDEYGTSVMSIQFDRGDINTVSIMNRYNHRVDNPDCTLGNNLERIAVGLTDSFEREYGFNIYRPMLNQDFLITYMFYIKASDGKYYSYNYEYDGVYYCENNIIVDHGKLVNKYAQNKERYILMDYYVLDMQDKKIYTHDKYIDDSFVDSIDALGKIKKIVVSKENDNKIINIQSEYASCEIKIDRRNKIIAYENNYVEVIKNNFMRYCDGIANIELNNALKIGSNFLPYCSDIKHLNLQNVREIDNNFLKSSYELQEITLPKVLKIGNNFLSGNIKLEKIYAPYLEYVGYCFLKANNSLVSLNLPSLVFADDYFLEQNKKLVNVNLPEIEYLGEKSLLMNSNIDIYDQVLIDREKGDKHEKS